MKIIGGNTDYYDFAGSGIDETIVLDRRDMRSVTLPDSAGLPDVVARDWIDFGWERTQSLLVPFWAVMGGYAIPGIEVERIFDHGSEFERFYEPGPFWTRAENLFGDDKGRFAKRRLNAARSGFDRHLGLGLTDLTEVCLRHGMIVGQLRRERRPATAREPAGSIFQPLTLLEIGMAAAFPPHEAHMLISRYVGGVMASGADLPEISDRSKILKAGFDLKRSFRKRKP